MSLTRLPSRLALAPPRRGPLLTLLALTACASFAFVAAPAFGAFTYPFERQLVPSGGSFEALEPGSVAVNDSNGNTYVADSGSHGVDVFETSTGTQLASLDPSLTPAKSFGESLVAVAANNGTGAVYVLDSTDNVVDEFDSGGNYVCQITGSSTPSATECNGVAGSATPAGAFSTPRGITVDQATGEVYVVDAENGVVDVFGLEGAYVTQISLAAIPEGFNAFQTRGIAVSDFNGQVYLSDTGSTGAHVYVFNTAGEYLTTWMGSASTNPPGTPSGSFGGGFPSVAVDNATGFVYVTETTDLVTDVFDPSGGYLTQFSHSFTKPRGTAVDQANGNIYVSDDEGFSGPGVVDVFGTLVIPDVRPEAPTELKPVSVTLNGKVNPRGIALSDCHFDYGTSTSYGSSAACVPDAAAIPADSAEHPVTAAITGLSPDTTYHYRLQASNANGTNTGQPPQDVQFHTPGAGVHEEFATDVAASSATLGAAIDPNNAPTTYYFQYGPTTSYGSEAPALTASEPRGALAGSGEGDVQVSQHLQHNLTAGTTYHYRVLAVSELFPGSFEAFAGPDQTFTTQGAGAPTLPDGRQWQLVSPPEKHGALLLTDFQGEWDFQAAARGDAISYLTSAPTEPRPPGFTNFTQVLSTRGPGGWESLDLNPPHTEATGQSVGEGEEYQLFSGGLSLGALQPFGGFEPSLSPAASEQTAYLRTDFPSGEPASFCTTSCYRPLVTGCPEASQPCSPTVQAAADVPAGTVFGGLTSGECPQILCGPKFLAATPDLSHIVLRSEVALTKTLVEGGLYEWSAGKLQLISILPANEESGAAVAGGLAGPRRARIVSNDGSRVVWAAEQSGRHLYLRDTVQGETVRLDAVQSGGGEGPVHPLFQAASSDGSKVFFTDEQRLTEDAGAAHNEPDLYECEMVEEAAQLKCRLTDLTPANGGEAASVQSLVPGASDDGSWVYFVADGVQGANPAAVRGAPNLYVHHDGVTKLIAVLSGRDAPDWAQRSANESARGKVFLQTARVSPSGRWLAFQSNRPLVGYDNRDAVSGQPDEEVYLYDAGSGRLVCASCDPSGARPVGVESRSKGVESLALGEDGVWEHGTWVAANIPGWTTPLYQSRYLSDSGRVFFNSNDALVPQDVNGNEDVYQFEPAGVGGCSSSSATFSARSGGCADLISSGRSAEESAFIDASETGGDVFFLTSARLVPQDFDASLDMYDAHACTSSAPCLPAPSVAPPPCTTGDACKAAPSPQPDIFGEPSSATFSGAGNVTPAPSGPATGPKPPARAQLLAKALKACHTKHNRRKRLTCEKQAHKRYGTAHSGGKTLRHGRHR